MLADPALIILADDEKYAVDFFRTAVKNMCREYDLITFTTGDELLGYLDNIHNIRPRMVFLGANMPLVPSLKTLETLRSRHTSHEVPLVVYSNHLTRPVIHSFKKLGADFCITKPTSSIILQNLIEQLVNSVVGCES